MANIKITCFHMKTIHQSDSGFTIASYKTADAGVIPEGAKSKFQPKDETVAFTAVGNRLATTGNVEIEIVGKWEEGKHGLQLKVSSCTVLRPQTEEGIIAYLSSDLIKGVGNSIARAIVAEFGVDTLEVIEQTPERLLVIPGISEAKLESIVDTFKKSAGLRYIMSALADYGITPKKAEKIMDMYGAQAADIVDANPYALCKIHGFGFKTVDEMARKKGFSPEDPQRVRESVMFALVDSQGSGHLYLGEGDLTMAAMLLLRGKKAVDEATEVKMSNGVKRAILNLVQEGSLQEDNRSIYLPYNFTAERETAKIIKSMIHPTTITLENGECVDTKIAAVLSNVEEAQGISLADMQRAAVTMAVKNHFSIITGGPGTGKTTVIKALVAAYKAVSKGTVAYAAPTGRASGRLAESVGEKASTLHSALGLGAEGAEAKRRIDADLLIVDECSMIDMQLAYQLFKSLDPETKLIFVGDYNQLPSVGAGNVLRELLLCGAVPVTKLNVVQRLGATSRIHLNAVQMLEGQTHLLNGDDFEFWQCDEPETAADKVKDLYFKYIRELDSKGKPFGADGVQILAPMRKNGKCGVDGLNKSIQAHINPKSSGRPDITTGYKTFRLFDKVIQMKNDSERGVSNGDVGRIKVISKNDGVAIVTIDFGFGRVVQYNQEQMEDVELAYATTIHKSQGSEYQVVIIPVLAEAYMLLQRNLLYTAVTRGKTKVIFVGQKRALYMGIHKAEMANRNTVLGKHVARPA